MTRALVIGKFYPPTAGHHHLIRCAVSLADHIAVVVMAARQESIPLQARVDWIRAEHPDVEVFGIRCDLPTDLEDHTVWAAQVALMRAALGDRQVDVVVSGEAYGEQLARWFGAEHRRVDRAEIPISGTQARADLTGHWDQLAPATRAGLATRVVVLGAESTGTTTIAHGLADHFGQRWSDTRYVGEYGRDQTVAKLGDSDGGVHDIVWTPADFDHIGVEQTRREDAAAAAGSPLLVCDTDALATAIWERRYLGVLDRPRPWAVLDPVRRIYLVTDHEGVPWVDDGLREGDLAIRAAMTAWFTDALTAAGQSWAILTGTAEQRLRLAVRTCEVVLGSSLHFANPIS